MEQLFTSWRRFYQDFAFMGNIEHLQEQCGTKALHFYEQDCSVQWMAQMGVDQVFLFGLKSQTRTVNEF